MPDATPPPQDLTYASIRLLGDIDALPRPCRWPAIDWANRLRAIEAAAAARALAAQERPTDWSKTWRDDQTAAGLTRDEAMDWAVRGARALAAAAERERELAAALRDLANDLEDDCGCPLLDRSDGPVHGSGCPIRVHDAAIAAARALAAQARPPDWSGTWVTNATRALATAAGRERELVAALEEIERTLAPSGFPQTGEHIVHAWNVAMRALAAPDAAGPEAGT